MFIFAFTIYISLSLSYNLGFVLIGEILGWMKNGKKKKWRNNWFYEYLVGEKGRMELVGPMYFLPKFTKMFYSWIEDKIEEKTITKNSDQKALCIVQTMWKPQCNVFFFLSFLLFILFFISFDFLLFFLGCCLFQVLFIHSKSFFFHLFWFPFFGSSFFCFPLIYYFYFIFI